MLMRNETKDTICAPATAQGGAIGIIRISGEKAIPITNKMFRKNLAEAKAYSIHYGEILNHDNDVIDNVLVSIFRAPHSYTGEDAVEISCHGSTYIINKVLELLVTNGCRMAQPGEFTMRAFLNGKLDLSQAEAVADLIASTNKSMHDIALSQLRGGFSSELAKLREQLLRLTSLLELELDFSDHEDLEFADRSELLTLTHQTDNRITTLAHSFETGQAIKKGIPVAIVGRTNVGKSTLLNALLKEDRAIVSDIHGTTRDTIEDIANINDMQFRFIDTAGIRQTTDTVEQIGIDRTYKAIEKAQIVVWVFDQEPTNEEQEDIRQRTDEKALIAVHNKADLLHDTPYIPALPSTIYLCAKKEEDVEQLKARIHDAAKRRYQLNEDITVVSARHYEALVNAHKSLQCVIDGLNANTSGELLAEDLRLALAYLGEITGGTITTEETLQNIFQHFCVGK